MSKTEAGIYPSRNKFPVPEEKTPQRKTNFSFIHRFLH